jgi:anaerobic glycerol-3-phosphate dehydrogenase
VLLVRRGYGGTATGSGAIDVIGASPCESLGLMTCAHHDPAHALGSLLKRLPAHPYTLLADGSAGPVDPWPAFRARFDAASDFLLDHLAKAGLAVSGRLDALTAHATTHGTLRLTNLAPLSINAGDVAALRVARVALVGVEGVGAFDPSFVGRSLQAILARERPDALAAMEPCRADPGHARRAGSSRRRSRGPRRPERQDYFAEECPRPGRCVLHHAILAPVLGILRHAEAPRAAWRRRIPVSEPLVPLPLRSTELRMQKALDRALAASRVRLFPRVGGAEIAGRPILASRRGRAGPVKIRAERSCSPPALHRRRKLTGAAPCGRRYSGSRVPPRAAWATARFSLLRPGCITRQPSSAGIARANRRRWTPTPRGFENLLPPGAILGGYDLALDGTGPA